MNKNYPLTKSEQGLYISSLNSGDAYNLANTINLGNPHDCPNFPIGFLVAIHKGNDCRG